MPKQTIKSSLFDESLADSEVIKYLTIELNRRKYMPIVKTTDGKLYRIEPEQEVTAEDVQSEVNLLQSKVTELQGVLAEVAAPVAAPEVPAEPEQPIQPEVPAAPEPATQQPSTIALQ